MIEKEITYNSQDFDEPIVSLISDELEKTASSYDPGIMEYLSKLEKQDNVIYALVNALTAGEFYGANKNGDYFREDELKKYHPTFQSHGHVYTHHKNKDPNKSFGKVLFSTYNPKMRRVELIITLDLRRPGIDSIIEKIKEGKTLATSMGTKVPYDVCSICGNKAKTRREYCNHAKFHMGEIWKDGRKVYVDNPRPKFFDISIVTIPADPTSSFIRVFNLDHALSKNAEAKQAERESAAEIKKNIEANIEALEEDPKNLILKSQGKLSDEKIKKLASYPLEQTLSTMLGLRIMPTPMEFQKIALYHLGREEEAKQLEREGILFEYAKPAKVKALKPENYNEKIAEIIGDDVLELSLLKPLVTSRLLVKSAQMQNSAIDNRSYIKKIFFDKKEPDYEESPIKNPVGPMFTLGSLYAGYAKVFGDKTVTGFTKFISRNPWVAPLIGIGAAGAVTEMQKMLYEDSASKTAAVRGAGELFLLNSLVGIPASYFYSGKSEYKRQKGQPITNVENFVRNNPLVSGLMASAGAVPIQRGMTTSLSALKGKLFKTAESFCRLNTKTQTSLYNSLIN